MRRGAAGGNDTHTVAGYSRADMEIATVTRRPAGPLAAPFAVAPRPAIGRASGTPAWHRLALAGLLLVTLLLRLWGIRQGLPFSYNSDEAQHFVPKAIGFLSGDWDPHYFLNPPAYSYLLAIVFELWFGSTDAVIRTYTVDPTAVFVLARVVAAVLGTVSVLLLYAGARKLFHRDVALLAAAIFGLAFLPIFYSHLALNDVPTLFGVTLSLYGIGGVFRDGRRRDYLIAGVAVGLAAATKYTGGITLICLLVAGAHDGARRGWRPVATWLVAALALGLAVFTLANPYWLFDFSSFRSGITQQASESAGSQPEKLGTTPGGGILYYLWTFSWGMGLGPAVAAAAGIGLLIVRRHWWRLALIVPAGIVFIVFMGVQQRYFGRWLLPIFPLASILAGYAGVELIRFMVRRRGVAPVLAGAVVAVALLTQSALADIHDDRVLSRPDTVNLVRAWMVAHIPAGQNVVIEPVIPSNWPTDIDREQPWTPTGQRWYEYPTQLSTIGANGRVLPDGARRYVTADQYERVLRPSLIAHYERLGYCWVVIGSMEYGRAFVSPQQAPGAIAYYRALRRAGRLMYTVSPYGAGANSIPFGFDWSIDYYPRQYRLGGPQMEVYRLDQGGCAAG
jgi:hypothetical protein